MTEAVPLFRMSVTDAEHRAVTAVIGRGSHWAEGPEVSAFEEKVAAYMGRSHCVAVNSGTSALFLGLLARGVGAGDEVIVPSFTFIATANAVALTGARPVFCEVDGDLCMDPADVAERVTPRACAVVPVHYAGSVADIRSLREVADDHGLWLFEDAAQAMGAERDSRRAGSSGDAVALSFCQNKVITTAGEGGAVLTDDDDLATRLRRLRSHGRVAGDYFGQSRDLETVEPGHNMRLSSVQAAVGSVQLDRVESMIAGRRKAAAAYVEALDKVQGVTVHPEPHGGRHVRQLMTILFDEPEDRDRVMEALAGSSIACKVYHDPVHLTGPYRGTAELPRTEDLARRVLSLPMHADLDAATAARVADAVASAMGGAP